MPAAHDPEEFLDIRGFCICLPALAEQIFVVEVELAFTDRTTI